MDGINGRDSGHHCCYLALERTPITMQPHYGMKVTKGTGGGYYSASNIDPSDSNYVNGLARQPKPKTHAE